MEDKWNNISYCMKEDCQYVAKSYEITRSIVLLRYIGWMKPNSNIKSQGLGSLLNWAIFSVKKLDLHAIQLKGGTALKYWSAFFDTLVSWLPWTRE